MPRRPRRWPKPPVALIAIVLLVVVLGLWRAVPLDRWIAGFADWLAALGGWGVLAFAAAKLVGTLLLAPGSVFAIAAGVAYGLWGLPLTIAVATLAAAAAFLIARYAARERVMFAIAHRPGLVALAEAVDESGWRLVLMLRLSLPVPFALTNYLFGVSRIGFWPFVAVTPIGIVPPTFVWVHLGAMGHLASTGAATPMQWVAFAVGAGFALATAVLVTRKAKAKLREIEARRRPRYRAAAEAVPVETS